MFRITGKRVSTRISKARGGARVRRLPSIILGDGAVIKIHPNRSVLVSDRDLRANANRISEFVDMIIISRPTPPFSNVSLYDILNGTDEPAQNVTDRDEAPTEPPSPIEPEPVVEERVEEPTQPPPAVEPEPIVEEPEPEPIVEEPEPEPVAEKPAPAPKKRRKRRTKAQIAADKAAAKKG